MNDPVIDSLWEDLNDILSKIEAKNGEIGIIQPLLDEADDMIKDINIHIRTLDSKTRASHKQRVLGFEGKIGEYKKNLLLHKKAVYNSLPPEQQKSLTMQKQTHILREAKEKLFEMEEMGTGTLENLSVQRDTILKTKDNTTNINEELNFSDKVLKRMNKWWRG